MSKCRNDVLVKTGECVGLLPTYVSYNKVKSQRGGLNPSLQREMVQVGRLAGISATL